MDALRDENDKLVDLKLSLVEKDYERICDRVVRTYLAVERLHALEISVLAALIAFSSKDIILVETAFVAGIIFILGCTIIEGLSMASIGFWVADAKELERNLSADTLEQFQENIVHWKFQFTRSKPRTLLMWGKRFYWAVRLWKFWLWPILLFAMLFVAIKGL